MQYNAKRNVMEVENALARATLSPALGSDVRTEMLGFGMMGTNWKL